MIKIEVEIFSPYLINRQKKNLVEFKCILNKDVFIFHHENYIKLAYNDD